MDNLRCFVDGALMPLAMSIFGGIAKTASQGWRSWKKFIADLCVSAFAGFIVHLLINDANITAGTKAALVGMSGFSGVLVLEGLSLVTIRILERVTGHVFTKPKWDGTERRRKPRDNNENE